MKAVIDQGKHLAGRHGGRFVKFLGAGLPSFLVAVPLNYALVTYVGLPKAVAYAIVLVFQVSVNFGMCRWLVFKARNERHVAVQFSQFLASILGFRVLDWALYAFAVHVLGVPFLLMQFANIAIFALLKYWASFKIIGK